MNTNTGQIAALATLVADDLATHPNCRREKSDIPPHIVPIDPANLSAANRALLECHGTVTVTRNSKCPCGSGKRFKRCHMTKPTPA
jgi:uncharacterized protein YecA (UPF0149 family)